MSRSPILRIALPAIVSNITVPLLGLADTAIVGHLGSPVYMGAIAVGSMIFSIFYWVFGFLRAGTSGFTAQALGAGARGEVTAVLLRSCCFALVISFLLLLFQYPISRLALQLIDASAEVKAEALTYFRICIWGAPAVILLYGFNGWLIGLQNTRATMIIALVQNVSNVLLSLLFVFVFHWQVKGVALGTLAAQYVGLLLAVVVWRTRYPQYLRPTPGIAVLNRRDIMRFLHVNTHIFLRTLCILSVTSFFTIAGARRGDLILASNAVLLQFFYFFSYFMDGFSNAGEALAGQYAGAGRLSAFRFMVVRLFRWGISLAVIFTLVYGVGGRLFLSLLTDSAVVLEQAEADVLWIAVIPFAGFAAFLWDGIYIGVISTGLLFLSMLLATCGFFASYYCFEPLWGNHGLWLSFCLFLLLRGCFQTCFYSRLKRLDCFRSAE